MKMREDFSKSPIKITCDNMIIIWDNSRNYPNVIWDDENEVLIAFRVNTEDIQQGYPFEILVTEYEHIQYMEALVAPKDAVDFLNKNKDKMGDSYQLALDMVSKTISQRGYTGTIAMANVQK